jgi:hypothetical protein
VDPDSRKVCEEIFHPHEISICCCVYDSPFPNALKLYLQVNRRVYYKISLVTVRLMKLNGLNVAKYAIKITRNKIFLSLHRPF